ncbi:MAG: hypothetical protein ACMX3H_00905 [Sodalis sp. (in: enterobacteria)]|uniref:hypothetical protein n=1 Tax=Sodalis sp. (in: enterobacteria) TaxID=1898979 RepID=UPI0039E2748B
MRLNVRLSAMTAMLCALVTQLMLVGSALSYFRLHQQRLDRQLTAMADSFDRLMLTEPLPAAAAPWLPLAMDSAGITRLELLRRGEAVYHPAAAGITAAAPSRLPVGHLLHRHAGQRCPFPASYRAG